MGRVFGNRLDGVLSWVMRLAERMQMGLLRWVGSGQELALTTGKNRPIADIRVRQQTTQYR